MTKGMGCGGKTIDMERDCLKEELTQLEDSVTDITKQFQDTLETRVVFDTLFSEGYNGFKRLYILPTENQKYNFAIEDVARDFKRKTKITIQVVHEYIKKSSSIVKYTLHLLSAVQECLVNTYETYNKLKVDMDNASAPERANVAQIAQNKMAETVDVFVKLCALRTKVNTYDNKLTNLQAREAKERFGE